MLTLATNLLVWVLDVTNDSMHREIEAELNALMRKLSGTEETAPPTPKCTRTCTHTHTDVLSISALGKERRDK